MDGRMATALATLMSMPTVALAPQRSPVVRLTRLEAALGAGCPTLLMKRDDLLPFALGGNKVRKLQILAAQAQRAGADTLITCGAVQSNHARVTAAVGAALGWRVVLVLNGTAPVPPVGNFAHDILFGAEVRVIAARSERDAAMVQAAEDVRRRGGHPFVIPVGGSTPGGAAGMARAVAELAADGVKPDVIVHASSSAGTQAGLVAGCALFGSNARVVGVSADEPAPVLEKNVRELVERLAVLLGARPDSLLGPHPIDVDDTQVGPGYGVDTEASLDTISTLARTEGCMLDRVYTSKAMAALLTRVRAGEFSRDQTVLFWHTGGLIG
jgi:1-aminocyclopropane-1-carboxylate deaminase/D-cysteine desulfhydrase-like pyridoxal-dependent ACC family enzyme